MSNLLNFDTLSLQAQKELENKSGVTSLSTPAVNSPVSEPVITDTEINQITDVNNTVSDVVTNNEQVVDSPVISEVDVTSVQPKVVTKKIKPKTVPVRKKSKVGASDEVFVRGLPLVIAGIARGMFPEMKSNADAISAYIYLHSDRTTIVADHIRDAVLSKDKEAVNPLINMEKRLASLEKQGHATRHTLHELELALAYLAFDKLGFRQDLPKTPRDIRFDETGVDDVLVRLREVSTIVRKREDIQTGRIKR